jgi:hypothetical protein
MQLAPTFDHASSLGRDLDDSERERRLSTSDRRFTVEHYCARGRSPLFSAARRLTVREAFARAVALRSDAASAWIDRLRGVPLDKLQSATEDVPMEAMSDAARAFARAVLACNRHYLLSVLPGP